MGKKLLPHLMSGLESVSSVQTQLRGSQRDSWSFLPFSLLKSANAQPRTVPNCISGQDSSRLNHRFFAKFQIILMAFELEHSMMICSIDSDSLHNMHLSQCSMLGILLQKLPIL